ncbi:MAG: diguanylate cyclase [Myxococcaceae bacterium]|nr:diguanylate cyclase [Myxococcaceae bacterium]
MKAAAAPPSPLLLVDAGAAVGAAWAQALEAAGYAVHRAATVSDAIQRTMDTTFCAAVVELALPGESGLSVVTHFASDDRGAPVLVLADERVVELLDAGAHDVLARATPLPELVARVRRCVQASERVQRLSLERDQLKALSTTDGLTQLANHRAFQERLREEFRRAQRYDDPMALILMDVDHFKAINDTHGHLAGDEVLHRVAQALRGAVRETDFVARYGGEEFGVLLPKTHLAGALTVAERMSQALKAARAGADGAIRVTASFGVSGFPGRGVTTAEQLLKTADEALYRSKREGRNKISLFQSSLFVAQSG